MTERFSCSTIFGILGAPLCQCAKVRPQLQERWIIDRSFTCVTCARYRHTSWSKLRWLEMCRPCSVRETGGGSGFRLRALPCWLPSALTVFMVWNSFCFLTFAPWLIRHIRFHRSIRACVLDPGIRPSGDTEGISVAVNRSPSFVLDIFGILHSLAQ